MPKPKSINELLKSGGKRLSSLAVRSARRGITLQGVCAAMPAGLAQQVVSAQLVDGKLTIGVASAAWASRLRYSIHELQIPLAKSLDANIHIIRIKVVPSKAEK